MLAYSAQSITFRLLDLVFLIAHSTLCKVSHQCHRSSRANVSWITTSMSVDPANQERRFDGTIDTSPQNDAFRAMFVTARVAWVRVIEVYPEKAHTHKGMISSDHNMCISTMGNTGPSRLRDCMQTTVLQFVHILSNTIPYRTWRRFWWRWWNPFALRL